jgi:hypothetical protein
MRPPIARERRLEALFAVFAPTATAKPRLGRIAPPAELAAIEIPSAVALIAIEIPPAVALIAIEIPPAITLIATEATRIAVVVAVAPAESHAGAHAEPHSARAHRSHPAAPAFVVAVAARGAARPHARPKLSSKVALGITSKAAPRITSKVAPELATRLTSEVAPKVTAETARTAVKSEPTALAARPRPCARPFVAAPKVTAETARAAVKSEPTAIAARPRHCGRPFVAPPERQSEPEAHSERPRQHREAALLAIVEALPQGRRGVGEALERPALPYHGIGTALQAGDRIFGGLRGRPDGGDAKVAAFAVSLLEGGPQALLVRGQLQPRMQRRNARFQKRTGILARDSRSVCPVRRRSRLLRRRLRLIRGGYRLVRRKLRQGTRRARNTRCAEDRDRCRPRNELPPHGTLLRFLIFRLRA